MVSATRKALIDFIYDHVLTDESSLDTQAMIEELDRVDPTERIESFCDRLALGDWFVDAMILSDIEIIGELTNITARKLLEEQEATESRMEIDHDLRLAQDAAV